MARDDDDPRAPYKVYEGEELKGTYATRAEARRAQQRLAEAEPQRNFVIKDVLGDVVLISVQQPPPQIRRGRLGKLWRVRNPDLAPLRRGFFLRAPGFQLD